MTNSIQQADYVFIQSFLRDRIGHELGEGKEYLVRSRLDSLAGRLGFEGVSQLVERLRVGRAPDLADEVASAMVTGETSFFRNPSAFDRLRTTVIPALLAARARDRRLRIWSAGCSTGQEPYSVALTLLDHFPEIDGWDIRILATDVSSLVLRDAEVGAFSAGQARRGLTGAMLRSFFDERDGLWWIRPEPRRMVQFQKHNLLDPPPAGSEFDLILIRNVLIYFGAGPRAQVFSALRQVIRDDGYLLLGESETILGQETDFTFGELAMDYYRPSRLQTSMLASYP